MAIGEHHVSGKSVAQRLARPLRSGEDEEQLPTTRPRPRRATARRNGHVGVHVEGLDDVMVRLSRCCTPVPGDEIIGFVTRGRGVSVHRADCANAVVAAADQTAPADRGRVGQRHAPAHVHRLDRGEGPRPVTSCCATCPNALSDHHVNIVACSTHTGSDRISKMRFDFELADPTHLDAVLRTIKTIDAVYDAYRIVPGAAGTDRGRPPPPVEQEPRRASSATIDTDRAPVGARAAR